uniref:BLTX434 n=1 Tax=Nephila pilipes TaxID=299642 RepID=A0A076KTX8_NEPPI|nr:BLTX434 [Nephila pilipes]
MNPVFLVASLVAVSVLGNIVNADDSGCPDIFQRYCSQHSYCLSPNRSCEILAYYPTDNEIKKIIHLHNMYRDQVATGRAGLPPAANMLELQWDPELAAVAQKYADQCRYEHDPSNCRRVMNFGVGQNIAIQKLTGGHTVPQADWEFAVRDWFREIMYFSQNDIDPFKPPSQSEYRHFSQLAWAKSFRVGCGYVLYKESNVFMDETYTRLYICNYGPAGNVYGSKVYEIGAQCSDCPINTCCVVHVECRHRIQFMS